VEIKKIILLILSTLILNGCVQSTAMVGPAISLASTGNIYQAGFTFSANKAVEKETGMQTHEYISKIIEENNLNSNNTNQFEQNLSALLLANFEKTRKIILNQNQESKN
tara:strand:+ start:684 stop:1010 length:327 start_codon:yes stop_codon:yes gene_type:complete